MLLLLKNMKINKFIEVLINEEFYSTVDLVKKNKYMTDLYERENVKYMVRKSKELGWSNVNFDNTIDDVEILGISVDDLPYPVGEYVGDDGDEWVNPNTGTTLIPDKKIPLSYSSSYSIHRPESKEIYYGGKWFNVYYYHDGTVIGVDWIVNKI